MTIKLDMSKSYDCVEWFFLESIMGFNSKWMSLMMECVQTVSYFVLINGEPREYFHPSKGLCQGDLIYPYLFLLCAEGLNVLFAQVSQTKTIQGLSISRGGPQLTHIFFADNSVLFCRANMQKCNAILEILRKYKKASGQQVNQDKTTIFFSASTRSSTQDEIKTLFSCQLLRNMRNTWDSHLWWGNQNMPHLLI